MSIPNKYFGVLEKLKRKSERGEVNWKETGKENTYIVSFDKFSIGISKSASIENGWCVRFYISDKSGRILEDYWAYKDPDELIEGTAFSAFDYISEIFDLARRKALRVDEAIKEINRELDKFGAIGTPPKKEEKDLPF